MYCGDNSIYICACIIKCEIFPMCGIESDSINNVHAFQSGAHFVHSVVISPLIILKLVTISVNGQHLMRILGRHVEVSFLAHIFRLRK